MTTWTELRTVALVGTERRTLSTDPDAALLASLPEDEDAEAVALHAAALLGTAHRAGAPIQHGPNQDRAHPTRPTTDTSSKTFAPHEAVQLLELMLTGNAGHADLSEPLFEQWFTRCTEHNMVIPHRLLVPVLNYATTTSRLRPMVSAALGERGHWLSEQRDKWSWTIADRSEDETDLTAIDLDEILQFSAAQRDSVLSRMRTADPDTGRQRIAEACERLDAASRARVLALLEPELSSADEDLLEAALDDRSKAVRTTAIKLLNGLTSSARAARLARQLEPLVETSGKLRKTIAITFPAPPDGEQLRDLSPDGNAAIEQQWFDALISGTALSWWEDTLQMAPDKIINARLSHGDELLYAWRQAAIAQGNEAWLKSLFDKTGDPTLAAFAGASTAKAAFLAGVAAKGATDHKQASLLRGVTDPWDLDFSERVLGWARRDDGKGAITRLNLVQGVMAERLSPEVQPTLTRWLDSVRGDEHSLLQRVLRNLIQQLSFRTSIDKAFS